MTEDMFRSTDERSAVIYKLANNIFSHGLIDAIIEKFGKSHFGWGLDIQIHYALAIM